MWLHTMQLCKWYMEISLIYFYVNLLLFFYRKFRRKLESRQHQSWSRKWESRTRKQSIRVESKFRRKSGIFLHSSRFFSMFSFLLFFFPTFVIFVPCLFYIFFLYFLSLSDNFSEFLVRWWDKLILTPRGPYPIFSKTPKYWIFNYCANMRVTYS